ncbi:MAG: hypothetical protein NW207_12165 [Cytophagales bacterium]|nr:hypothetical protein [Cytophagales bacterium]
MKTYACNPQGTVYAPSSYEHQTGCYTEDECNENCCSYNPDNECNFVPVSSDNNLQWLLIGGIVICLGAEVFRNKKLSI